MKTNAPKLEGMIRELIALELHGKKDGPDSKRLMREILTLSQKMYMMNFNDGFEVDPYRLWMIVLFALAGMAGGAARDDGHDLGESRRGRQ